MCKNEIARSLRQGEARTRVKECEQVDGNFNMCSARVMSEKDACIWLNQDRKLIAML